MKYSIDELELKNNTFEEAVRTREIFDEIKSRDEKGEKIYEHEKNFFCKGVMLSKDDDGVIEDYNCCDSFKFKFLYLVYYDNLTLKGKHYKPQGVAISEVPKDEVKKDLFYLWKVADEWKDIINDTRISDELLKQIAKETRAEINLLNTQLEPKITFEYNTALRSLLLSSKYLYLMALEIYEVYDPNDMIFELNGVTIEFNEYSIIHILKRHFAEVTKKYVSDKSYHSQMVDPRIMYIQLKDIFNQIDKSGVYNSDSINKLTFVLNGIIYQVWINERTKSIKGKGNVIYNRLETFYPLIKTEDIDKLNEEYELQGINESLGVYIKKRC